MALGKCGNEIEDCDLGQIGFDQLFRKLLRKDGNCFYLNVGNPNVSNLLTSYSFNAANRAAVDTGLQTFKTANPDANIVFRDIVWNGSSYDVFIEYK